MAAAAPVSLGGVGPSPGKVSFEETTAVIEAKWGEGGTKPNNALYMAAMIQAVTTYQEGKEQREKAQRRELFPPDGMSSTPPHLLGAAQDGDCGAIGQLLDGGLNVDALAKNPETGQPTTALQLAVSNKHE